MIKALLILALIVGAGPTQAKEPVDVLFINPGFEHGFWGNVSSTMKASAEDLSINLEIVSADRDRIQMLMLIREAVSREKLPDYAVIVNELQQGPQMAQILESAGIPYLFLLNRLTPEQMTDLKAGRTFNHYLGSIAPDNHETGYMTAKALINAQREKSDIAEEIQVLALLGDIATPAATEREAGMLQAIAEAPNARVLRAFSVDWLFDRAKQAVSQFLKRGNADIIWTASGPIAFGAMEAVTEAGLTPGKDVKFAGVGWFPNALDAVSAQTMVMTYGGYFISGAWAMVMIHDIQSGIELENEGEIQAPLSEVNLENIDEFQRYIRDVDWAVVDFLRFTRQSTHQPTYDFSASTLLKNIKQSVESAACTEC